MDEDWLGRLINVATVLLIVIVVMVICSVIFGYAAGWIP